jgi:5-methylcytosine-specific restriction endonuclease McrA
MRMTEEMVARAREMRADGMSYEKIGAAVGVCGGTIQYNLNPALRTRHAEYCASHKEEKRTYNVIYRAAHLEEERVRGAAYRATHVEEKAAYFAAYRAEHEKEKREYCKRHAPEFAAYSAARRALLAGVLIGATAAQRAEIKVIYKRAKDDGTVRCYLCGRRVPLGERHVDHIMPLSKGGLHRPSNLAIACAACNVRKKDKRPEEVGVLL